MDNNIHLLSEEVRVWGFPGSALSGSNEQTGSSERKVAVLLLEPTLELHMP